MLKRKIEEKLKRWKEKEDKLPLLIEGARQVGKTTSIRSFAAENYKCFVELNFYEHPEFVKIFSSSLDPDSILSRITLYRPDLSLKEGSTLLFLDEIQHCPNARVALKFLAKDKRFDIIATGSLLGLNFKEIKSVPVGYTEHLEMHPMDFEEFLWALGIREDIIGMLRECYEKRTAVDPFIHDTMLDYFTTYTVIGGMPHVVETFAKNRNYAEAMKIQSDILSDYRADVIKYADDRERSKILRCFESIPIQLAKDYKKFQYSSVEKGASSTKYAIALAWLKDASIVSFCHNLSLLQAPLEAYKAEKEFKVYLNDTGLLISMYGIEAQRRIAEGEGGIYKGAIFENIIACTLKGLGSKLYYFSPSASLEIDFVISYRGKPCLLEVKSGDNNRSKSLKTVLSNPKYNITQAIRLSRRNVKKENGILSLPLYMAFLLKDEREEELKDLNLPSYEDLRSYLDSAK